MIVESLQPKDREKWDVFVNQHSEGRFIHSAAYKDILEKTYGYKGHFLYIRGQGGEILSIFPFFEFKSLFKKKFVSQLFSEYGGILFNTKLTLKEKGEIVQTWKEYLKKFLLKREMPYLEIHGQLDQPDLVSRHFVKKSLHKIALLRLDSYESLYQKFDRQIKKALKKAEREGIKVFEETNLESIKNKFYPLYARYLKERHGTPPYPLDFFLNCYQYAPQNIRIFFAEKDQKIIAALWGFYTNQRIQISYNPSLKEYFLQRPNDFLHAKFIEWGCQNNFRYFDFGPASYPGQIDYKKKWGVEFVDYSYFYFSNSPISPKPVVPGTKIMKLFSWAWKKILPQFIANKLGPYIRKNLGK